MQLFDSLHAKIDATLPTGSRSQPSRRSASAARKRGPATAKLKSQKPACRQAGKKSKVQFKSQNYPNLIPN
jgi:hypothetical protein